jgi:hypothetical protein
VVNESKPRGHSADRDTGHPTSHRMAEGLPEWIDPPLAVAERPTIVAPSPSDPAPVAQVLLRTCQWLHGEPRDLSWCGAAVAFPGSSWCDDHEHVVYPHGRPRPVH